MDGPPENATIYALGTPTPSRAHPGAISVIRLSGPRAADALIFLTERRAFERGHSARDPALPEARRMALRTVHVVLDAMQTGPAIRTYNIMLGERRRVAAALIAVP